MRHRDRIAGQDAVLVRGFRVDQPLAAEGHGHAGIDRRSLVAGVDHGTIRHRLAHHAGEDEERVLEAAEGRAVGLAIAGVIGIHEDVGAGLDLVPDAGLGLQLMGARAGAGDDLAGQAVMLEPLDRVAGGKSGALDRLAPLVDRAHVLGRAVISVDAGEAQGVGA